MPRCSSEVTLHLSLLVLPSAGGFSQFPLAPGTRHRACSSEVPPPSASLCYLSYPWQFQPTIPVWHHILLAWPALSTRGSDVSPHSASFATYWSPAMLLCLCYTAPLGGPGSAPLSVTLPAFPDSATAACSSDVPPFNTSASICYLLLPSAVTGHVTPLLPFLTLSLFFFCDWSAAVPCN